MYTEEIVTSVNVEDRQKLGLRPGDTVRVWQKIQEKGKIALQAFDGLVISTKHATEPGATFTVRATIEGIGVEKIFPLYSPFIDKIEIVRHAKVRRSKLYYIRDKFAKTIRQKLRRSVASVKQTVSDEAEKKKHEEMEARRIAEAEAKAKAEEEVRAKAEAEAQAKAQEAENANAEVTNQEESGDEPTPETPSDADAGTGNVEETKEEVKEEEVVAENTETKEETPAEEKKEE